MSEGRRRRPVRFWAATPGPVNADELTGPRGLVAEIMAEPAESPAHEPQGDDAFWMALLSDARRARIDSVVAARLASVTCVVDKLYDPHNVAAIVRTAEGLGLSAVHVVPNDGADAIAHRRVTQDADKWLDLQQHASGAEAAKALVAKGYSVYAGHLDEHAVLLEELPADRPLALLFGHEHEGPSRETLAACTGTFKIPMAGFTQSFNVSVAAAISLAHLARSRRGILGAAGDLPEAGRRALRSKWYRLAAKLSRRMPNAPELVRK